MDSKFHQLQWSCIFLLLFFMVSCSLKLLSKEPAGEKEFFRETSRLEKLAREHPKTSVRAQSHMQLAFLYVNDRNPQLDYSRALQEMESYLSLSPDKGQTVDFQNWLAVLREMNYLRRDRIRMGEKNQALQDRVEKLQTSLESAQKVSRSLHDEVANLKESNNKMREAIQRLKNLDRQMEERRDLIK
jgi:outer membrane protein assembly factor BamD (BamD/ComL family)